MERRSDNPEVRQGLAGTLRSPCDREAFFVWLDRTAAANAGHNAGLNDAEVLTIIEEARAEVSARMVQVVSSNQRA